MSSPSPGDADGASPKIIGWRELVSLPDWQISDLEAKADTGARTSAIDVDGLEELPGDRVRFEVVADRAPGGLRRILEADIVRRSRVRSSHGEAHPRFFVETTLILAGVELRAEIGLVSRENMISRMLLGRRLLKHQPFLVDSGSRYLHARPSRRGKRSSVQP